MKPHRDSSLEQILLFARGRTIYAMEDESSIFPVVQRPQYVTSLTMHNGRVLDSGNYKGIFETATDELISPFLYSQSFQDIAGIQGRLFGLQQDGQFRDVNEPNATPNLELENIQGISGGNKLTYWGENSRKPINSYDAHVGNTFLKDYNPLDKSTSTIYEHMLSANFQYTQYEGFLAACESNDGERFVVQKSGEVFLDEGHKNGLMRRIGLPKSLELSIFKRGMRICRSKISGNVDFKCGDWSTNDETKKEGWEEFLELCSKYGNLFPKSVWEIRDITEFWPQKETLGVEFRPLPYEDAYQYFESQLGVDCKKYTEFQRSQSKGYLKGASIDYAVEAVLGNMIKYTLHRNRTNAIAHLDDSIYLGTQDGRVIKMSDEIDSRRTSILSTKTYYNGIESLRSNPNGSYWELNHYFYPVGWAQGKEIKLPGKSKRKLPITAICAIPQEVYEGTGLQQRVNNLRRNKRYFASGGNREVVTPFRKAS